MKALFGLFLLTTCLFTPCSLATKKQQQPIVIMLGIDGLRANILDQINAPNLQSLANSGVRANMIPAMPTKTFVNFYSLATGLHPQAHGLISNYPFDRKLGRKFNRSKDAGNPFWWGGEPIWITAEKQGVVSATYFWVGSEVAIEGVRPTYWKPYNQSKPYGERVTEVLNWLKLPIAERPRFITLYFSAVDSAAHNYGVGSPQEKRAVERVDRHIGSLLNGLKQMDLFDQTNFVVVADHGMINLSDERVINIDPLADLSGFEIPDWRSANNSVYAPFLNLYGEQKQIDVIYQQLKRVHPHMRVFRRGSFPERYHFDHPDRGPDLMLLADPGWTIYASRNGDVPVPINIKKRTMATHGYDNQHPSMQATFIGSGNAFKSNLQVKPFDNIEVYGILACILEIEPAKTDGDIKQVEYMLSKPCE